MSLNETLPYDASRERFCRRAQEAGWEVATIVTPRDGADGDDAPAASLSLDVAWRGPSDAARSVLVTAGLHGVEGFFGSDLLLDWFRAVGAQSSAAADGVRMVAVHCLNPFGYTHRRRANEQNIDLNRNFLLPGQHYDEAPAFDHELDQLLHPSKPLGPADWFRLRLALLAARRGPKRVQQRIAGGQVSNAEGLFFGGRAPSPFFKWCEANWENVIGSAPHVTHFDLHSGLGAYGAVKLLLQPGIDAPGVARMQGCFGTACVVPPPTLSAGAGDRRGDAASNDLPYQARGTWGCWLQHRFSDRQYEYACAEFGTYGPFRVIAALRAENIAWHHYGPASPEQQRAADRLRDCFYPPSRRWRVRVRARFLSLMEATARRTGPSLRAIRG